MSKKVKKQEKPKVCKHEETYPVAFFDEQDYLDMPILILECAKCDVAIAAYGGRLGGYEVE